MQFKQPVVDYRKLRFNNFWKGEFEHLRLLLFWPLFGLMFLFVERFYKVDSYFPMHCGLDDIIPFCEWFLIPYLFWFVFLVGMHIFTLLYDLEAYKRMMKYIIITFTVTSVIYLIFPTCQELRPTEFERANFLTEFIGGFYEFDTNTNVCPSLHVIGSLAVMEAAIGSKAIKSKYVKLVIYLTAMLISISTVFMKQHSILDVLAALPICIIAHLICCKKKRV